MHITVIAVELAKRSSSRGGWHGVCQFGVDRLPSQGDNPVMSESAQDARLPIEGDVARVLVDNHRQFLAFLERRIGNRALAEDILQEAFTRGIERQSEIRNEESAVAWFYRVLRNAVVDHHRRNESARRALESFGNEIELHVEPEKEMQDAICQCVTRLSSTLKAEYREALERIDVQGLSVKDFAAEQGISASNAAVRVFRARDALRKQVTASCGTCAEHGCIECTCESKSSHGCGSKN
jgi:RNA polymerase sigma factor (sigma-70 family)